MDHTVQFPAIGLDCRFSGWCADAGGGAVSVAGKGHGSFLHLVHSSVSGIGVGEAELESTIAV